MHHKIHLDYTNVYDESIALSEDNLEGLCIDCHNKEHFSTNVTKSDVMFDEEGNLVRK